MDFMTDILAVASLYPIHAAVICLMGGFLLAVSTIMALD